MKKDYHWQRHVGRQSQMVVHIPKYTRRKCIMLSREQRCGIGRATTCRPMGRPLRAYSHGNVWHCSRIAPSGSDPRDDHLSQPFGAEGPAEGNGNICMICVVNLTSSCRLETVTIAVAVTRITVSLPAESQPYFPLVSPGVESPARASGCSAQASVEWLSG